MSMKNFSSGTAGCLNPENESRLVDSYGAEKTPCKNTFSKDSESKDLMWFSDGSGDEKKERGSTDTEQHQEGRTTLRSDAEDSQRKPPQSMRTFEYQYKDSGEPLGRKTKEPKREQYVSWSSVKGDLNKKPGGAVCYSNRLSRDQVKGQEHKNLREEDDEQSSGVYHSEIRQVDMGEYPSYTKEDMLPIGSPVDPVDHGPSCMGVDLYHLKTIGPHHRLPLLRPSAEHVVLVEVSSVGPGSMPTPYKGTQADIWSRDYVRMPHSPHNLYESNLTFSGTKCRWTIITKALGKNLSSAHDIEKAIKKYNKKYESVWKFNALDSFFASVEREQNYLESVIPKMAELALKLPTICPKPIPMLKKGHRRAITMSQQQIACLLANAFFCTFPRRNATQGNSEYATYPSINFNRLFDEENSSKREKMRALLCYFNQVVTDMRTGLVTFERRKLPYERKQWSRSQANFTRLHVSSEGTIEDNGKGMLQVDFASPIVGGGVLGSGLVQEEIRFLINTELIVSRLFTEKLDDDECLLITGAEQYSCYSGYSRHFKWKDCESDSTPRDDWQRRCIEIVAIDAIRFRDPREQFTRANIERDLNKAYCGFKVGSFLPQENVSVATGNWGCGAFNGNPKMKGLLQLMAAAEAGRDVAYFTFGDHHTMKELHDMHLFLEDGFTVGQLFTCLEKYFMDWKNMSSFYNELKSKLYISKI